ncbi:MAG: RHS repeat-associated core domain-containing protein, partial [Actinobacteria bacterium]|nr:RHS repeat-associated core domain-containing protein [Actinomycetota bacterium]
KGSKTYTYNAASQITNSGFTYDVNGNLTSDGKFNYTYDTENHLTKVTKVSDGSTVATYEYDYRGLRISKTTPSGTTKYHWDSKERLIRESDAYNNTIALYTYDDKGKLVAIEKDDKIYYTHTNHRGDILSITDANKQRIATYKYDPWGTLLSKTGTFDIPIRYAGYYFDSETGLYYLKARYYSPELGRFLTKDTFKGFNDRPRSLNLYAYANGNPVMNVDPDGDVALPLVAYGAYLLATAGVVAYYKWVNDPDTQAAIATYSYKLQQQIRAGLNWLYMRKQRHIDGWNVVIEQHYGKVHARWWKKGSPPGSVKKNGGPHDDGLKRKKPPTEKIKKWLRENGFKV